MKKYILPWEFDKNKKHERRYVLGKPFVEAAVFEDKSLTPDYPVYYTVRIYTTAVDYGKHKNISFETREAAKNYADSILIKKGYTFLPEHLLVLK